MLSASHRSVVAGPIRNLPARRISAEIVQHTRINFAKLRDEYRAECADLVHRAYPAPSPNACANAAAKATGIPSDTFYRILRQETIDPSFPAVAWNEGKSYAIGGGDRCYRTRHSWAKAAISRYGNKCERCGWSESRCDVHHRHAKAQGGLHTLDNAIVLCPNCHRIEHDGKRK